MAFPKLAAFDAKSFAARLKTSIGQFSVFDQFVDYKKSVDILRDASAATAVFAQDLKNDIDGQAAELADHHARLGVLEAASSTTPFPASG